jgi:hypothetical protein
MNPREHRGPHMKQNSLNFITTRSTIVQENKVQTRARCFMYIVHMERAKERSETIPRTAVMVPKIDAESSQLTSGVGKRYRGFVSQSLGQSHFLPYADLKG